MAKRVVKDLIEYGKVRKSYFGILPGNVNRALVRSRGVGGVLVTEIEAGSPAQNAGLKIADVILSVDGLTVESPGEMLQLLDSYTPGYQIELEVLRGIEIVKRTVKLQALPDDYGLKYGERVFGLVVEARHDAVRVKAVVPGSHAAKAGIRPGDLVAEVAGIEVYSVEDYGRIMEQHVGDLPLSFLIVRDNRGYYLNLP